MKRIIALLALFVGVSTCIRAQYEEHKETRTGVNRSFDDISGLLCSQEAIPSLGGERGRLLFNFDWRFQLGNPEGAESEEYSDANWRQLDLPHDFQFEQPWDESAGGARGFKGRCEGWYRKTFTAPEEWQGLQVLLDIEGLMYYGDVYVNGQKIASSEYGYLGFEADMSKHLHYGAVNTIAIYANSGKSDASRWYTGAGLFRNVYLRLQNPTHIGRHGIYVATEMQGEGDAKVMVQVDVCGFPHGSGQQPKTTIRATIKDKDGASLGTSFAKVPTLTKHRHDEIVLPPIDLVSPTLWDIDNPYLYYIDVELYVDSLLVDHQVEHFGVRTIEYGSDFGFKLNGRKVFLKGMANHHDMGALGAASYDDAIRRQIRQMKAFGFNALRCSHNPYAPSLTRIADEEGLLIVDELIDKWSDDQYWGGRKPFTQLWPALIREWITRDRNCPSVVLWRIGNELQIRDNWSGYDTNDWGITTYRLFDVMVKRYDQTRPTTVAMFPARAGAIREEKEFKSYFAPPELALNTEVSSFNYQWDCYPKYFEHKPDMILFQSEAVTNQLTAPYWGMDRDRTVGLAYWGAIEYWGESNKWPKKGWNYSFFRHTLWPNPQAWLVRGTFIPEEPMVHIGVMTGGESVNWNAIQVGQKTYTESWNHQENSKQQVVTFTNADEVELIVNGEWRMENGKWVKIKGDGKNGSKVGKSKWTLVGAEPKLIKGISLGRQPNDTTDVYKRGVITWKDVPYEQGGSLTAIAYKDGKEVARHRIETADKAVHLVIEVEDEQIVNRKSSNRQIDNGMSLLYLNIYAVDKHGRIVPNFDEKLTIEVEGGASLLALDNGDHYTSELFHDINTKRMHQGRMQAILRSKRNTEKVKVRISTPSLHNSIIL